MKQLNIIIICILSCHMAAQDTFFKEISPHTTSTRLPQAVFILNEELYIQTSILCYTEIDSFICTGVSKYDEETNLVWEENFEWTVPANRRGLTIRNDSIFIGGHRTPGLSRQVFNLLVLNTDGDSLLAKVHDFSDVLDETGVFCNGIFLTDNYVFTFGMAELLHSEVEVLPVHRYDLVTDTDTLFVYEPEFGRYFPGWDMAEDEEGNLLVFNEIYFIAEEQKEILKIDKNGSVLSRLYGPDPDITDVEYQFVLMNDGSYTFLNQISSNSSVPIVINMDSSGAINWTHEFPNPNGTDTIGIYEIIEMITANNGDIILGGYRNRKKKLGTGYDIFLMRMSPSGEVLWERLFNEVVDMEEKKYRYFFTTDVQEYEDGSILIMGNTYHNDNIFLLKVDADGCSEEFGCEDEVILSNDFQPIHEIDNATYPNPTHGPTEIHLPSIRSGQYMIYNNRGKLLGTSSFSNTKKLTLDLGRYGSGLYFVNVFGEGYQSRVKILVME